MWKSLLVSSRFVKDVVNNRIRQMSIRWSFSLQSSLVSRFSPAFTQCCQGVCQEKRENRQRSETTTQLSRCVLNCTTPIMRLNRDFRAWFAIIWTSRLREKWCSISAYSAVIALALPNESLVDESSLLFSLEVHLMFVFVLLVFVDLVSCDVDMLLISVMTTPCPSRW